MSALTRRHIVGLGLALLPALGTQADPPPPPLRFATDGNDQGGLAPAGRAVLQRALERLGRRVRFEPLPLRRSLAMTARGELDGETLRLKSVADERPELLLVPVSIATVEVWAYAHDPALMPRTLKDLGGLRVAHQRGIVLLEKLLAGMPGRIEAATPADLLRLLRLDAVDVALLTLAAGQPPLPESRLAGLYTSPAPLYSAPLFPLLHGRHGELLPRLAAVLGEMEASGESALLRKTAWAQLPAP